MPAAPASLADQDDVLTSGNAGGILEQFVESNPSRFRNMRPFVFTRFPYVDDAGRYALMK
jgi:hypothetical protein